MRFPPAFALPVFSNKYKADVIHQSTHCMYNVVSLREKPVNPLCFCQTGFASRFLCLAQVNCLRSQRRDPQFCSFAFKTCNTGSAPVLVF